MGDMPNIIICANFGVEKLRGLGKTKGQILSSPLQQCCTTAQPVMNYNEQLLVRLEAIAFGVDLCFTAADFNLFIFIYFNARSLRCRPIGVKFCTVISSRPNFIMPIQNFGGPSPQKF